MDSVLVAFSGGVDSSFLLKVVSQVLAKDKFLAVTADSATFPKEELISARNFTRSNGIRHKVIRTQELRSRRFTANPFNRCYFCKKELFGRLKAIARKHLLQFVVDASNVSDKQDFRPGSQAKKEMGIRSPLQEAGFSKEEIRKQSRRLKLSTADKPSLACLASRIPYGKRIKPHILERINKAESALRNMGFQQVRLRHYNGLCRIEVDKKDIPALINKRNSVIAKLKRLGYNYITVDLQGYRTGSMNEGITR